ncbi:MAG: pyridoxal-dependent decarboxylase [Polyangiaceae bacterium]
MWVQRNELRQAHGATPNQIAILCSEDTHYSVYKAADLLGLDVRVIPVDRTTRAMRADALADIVEGAVAEGKKYFSCILNMGTTMFGSIDDPDLVVGAIEKHRARGVDYRLHVDAAFGGFLYPFSQPSNRLSFRDPRIVSMTMDAHKMLQAPYGTGIFLVRKGMLPYVCNEHAAYVHGKDYTLCGSRSGANAIAAWMILRAYGSEGGKAFVQEILGRTDRLCRGLDRLGIRYFREPHMNIVTMPAEQIPASVAHEFTLVPDSHEGDPQWWKIVVMDHVTDQAIDSFLTSLAHARTTR